MWREVCRRAPFALTPFVPHTYHFVPMHALSSIDRLSGLIDRFGIRAELHHTGALCGSSHFDACEGHGYLHLLRRGEVEVFHPTAKGIPQTLRFDVPALLLYPSPVTHHFRNHPVSGSDFTCARLTFEGGAGNPLARALPALIALPLSKVQGLEAALDLLFSETDRVRCGQRLVADRLFEVVLLQLLRWLLDHPQEAGVEPGLITGLSDPRLARALVAIHESPGEPWSLQSMADRAGMSRTAFATTFRDIVGQTPADYLTGWRILLAQNRLREGKPIKSIAEELGYANASAFSRTFAARTGRPPRTWLSDVPQA